MTAVASAGPGVAAATYTVFMLCMAATRLIGDRFVRRMGAVAVVRVGGIVAAAGGVLVVAGRTPWLCMAGFALVGVGWRSWCRSCSPPQATWATRRARASRGWRPSRTCRG
ncbi:hypothetical protein GCM10020219_042430 [Nonomuraea dietziae]